MVTLKNTGQELEEVALDEAVETVKTVETVEAVAETPETPATPASNDVETNDVQEGAEEAPANESNLKAGVRRLLGTVAKIGNEYGSGKKALTTLAITIVEGAAEQIITPALAEDFYNKFKQHADKRATVAGGAVVGANSEGSTKAQVSKLRAFIKFGNEWRDDAPPQIELALAVHTKLLANEADKKTLKLTSTYSALTALAREMMKEEHRGVPMDEDALRKFFLGDEAKVKTGADYVEAAMKSIRQAQKGKAGTDEDPTSGREAVTDPGLDRALDELRGVMQRIAPERWADMVAREEKEEAKAIAQDLEARVEEAVASFIAAE